MNAKIKISKETTIANVPACKEIIAALKNAETSLLDCILTETERADEVTTCKAVRGGDCVKTVRKCDIKRIGQTGITVRQAHYDTAPVIEVSFLAEENDMTTLANMILTGKILAEMGEFDADGVQAALKKVVSAKHPEMFDLNLKALQLGRDFK